MPANLEERVAELERLVAQLQQEKSLQHGGRTWLDDLYGRFEANSPFDQAMKPGRKYRNSLRPRPSKTKSKSKR
jgi:hypothetical protein